MSQVLDPLRDLSVQLDGGPRLHVVEQGDPGGPPVLLLHGWPDSWFSWSRVMPLLDLGRRVLAMDQRGFGDSERPASGYAIDDLAGDVLGLCDALGLEQPSLVGHSMGTFVARRAAERQPDRVSRLVLIGAADLMGHSLLHEVAGAIADLTDPVPEAFAREFQASTIHQPVPPDFFEGLVAESCKLPAYVYRAVWDGLAALDDRADVPRIASPTLVIWGDQDALFDRQQQERLLALLPHGNLVIMRGTGHCANWERPEEVAARLEEFLPPVGSHS